MDFLHRNSAEYNMPLMLHIFNWFIISLIFFARICLLIFLPRYIVPNF